MIINGKQNLKFSELNNDEIITVENGENVSLFLDNFVCDKNIQIEIKENAHLRFSCIADCKVENVKFLINLRKNSGFEAYFADFSVEKAHIDVEINLNEEGANAEWHLASLASHSDNKNISVSVNHNAPNTTGKVDNYGVVKNDAKLVFAGTSFIPNGSVKSKTNQNAKIMVFDCYSDAVAKPILKIDENDIEASHAAAVGKISDEHLFYLTSRGISIEEARTLITLGYLKPIFKGFEDKQIKYLNQLIEEQL